MTWTRSSTWWRGDWEHHRDYFHCQGCGSDGDWHTRVHFPRPTPSPDEEDPADGPDPD